MSLAQPIAIPSMPEYQPARASPVWLYGFVLVQFACQLGLLVQFGPSRTALRIATFASSLAMLVLVPLGGRPHPSRPLALAVILITCLGMAHPNLNSVMAGLAQITLTVAIWAPVLWTTRVRLPANALRNVILLLWGFHTCSSIAGVLQVYDPDTFAPEARFVEQLLGQRADGLKFKLADGTAIWRPMGLTDTPGGAAASGQFAFLVGLIVAISERNRLLRLIGLGGAAAGMFCIYLCQVRTSVVVTGIAVVCYAAINVYCKRMGKATLMVTLGAAVVLTAFSFAADVGGTVVTKRLASLTEDRVDIVYYKNRGIFLEDTLEKITHYPLGAGLGRWGMIAHYFGNSTNLLFDNLWVEIQPTGWLYDGGILLLLAGYAAFLNICWLSVKIAVGSRDLEIANWAALVAAINVGVLANTLTYPVFVSQTGMMCLMLNSMLFAAAVHRRRVTPIRYVVPSVDRRQVAPKRCMQPE